MDFNRLRLKYHGNPAKLDEILQAECRHKCARKLPDLLSIEGFRFPSTALAEMSTSEAVAAVHASMIQPGETVLDMTLGLGVDAFAMSRRGAIVTGIDIEPAATREATHNAVLLGLTDIRIINADSIGWLSADPSRHFAAIFIDPQRRDSSGRHFALADCVPDITRSSSILLSRCRRLIIKMSPMVDISAVASELSVSHCHIVIIGTAKECKEVVMITGSEITSGLVECVTIGHPSLTFTPGSGETAPAYATPQPGQLLLEPYPSVMKGASAGSLRHIPYPKLAPNTHLFLSDTVTDTFPGERMEIMEVMPFSKAVIKGFSKRYPVINVATRNFPLPAPELARRLKVREGGDRMLHGATLADGSRVLIVTSMPC